ncbi:signal recognition particle protein 19 [Spraguea lophii 42_110]|uniref:Signal recognition particle protein 19 n=1 Tax=Spraguea lophii (strain 42_110) TaxID=1358809 RepID=S7XKH7_SPRLO|nr:signal recognition particle protein 19 [Spraguea lophii 42_110]
MEEYFTIYPIYFNSSISLSAGRKYNKELCINLNYKELVHALQKLNMGFKEEKDKRHPKDINYGRVKVEKKYGKTFTISGIVETVKTIREEALKMEKEKKEKKVTTINEESTGKKTKLVSRKRVNKKKGKY